MQSNPFEDAGAAPFAGVTFGHLGAPAFAVATDPALAAAAGQQGASRKRNNNGGAAESDREPGSNKKPNRAALANKTNEADAQVSHQRADRPSACPGFSPRLPLSVALNMPSRLDLPAHLFAFFLPTAGCFPSLPGVRRGCCRSHADTFRQPLCVGTGGSSRVCSGTEPRQCRRSGRCLSWLRCERRSASR
jgi:hypothetical protein